jgi:hypothetical protein
MIRIQLPNAEVERGEHLFRTTTEAKLRHRLPIVLRAHRGRSPPDIAQDPGTSQRSVPRWLKASLERGRAGLRPLRPRERPPS